MATSGSQPFCSLINTLLISAQTSAFLRVCSVHLFLSIDSTEMKQRGSRALVRATEKLPSKKGSEGGESLVDFEKKTLFPSHCSYEKHWCVFQGSTEIKSTFSRKWKLSTSACVLPSATGVAMEDEGFWMIRLIYRSGPPAVFMVPLNQ